MKRVRTTSAEAYQEIAPTLGRREQTVFDALKTWRGEPPTSYELTRYLQDRDQAFDLNSVRPRLTMLSDMGFVRTGEKRKCTITKKRVFTWVVCHPSAAPEREPEPQWLTF